MKKIIFALFILFTSCAYAQSTNTLNPEFYGKPKHGMTRTENWQLRCYIPEPVSYIERNSNDADESIKNDPVVEFCSQYGGPEPVDTTYYSNGTFSVTFSIDKRICIKEVNGKGILLQNGEPFKGSRAEIVEAFNPGVRQGPNSKIAIIDSFGGGCFGIPTTTYASWEKGRWVVIKKDGQYQW